MKRPTLGTYGTMYYVSDMKKAVAFYKGLGFTARYESDDWTEFDLGDSTAVCLHGMGDFKPLSEGGILITKVKDIKGVVAEIKREGVEFVKGITEVHPGAYSADFKDPSGNVVSLYEDTNHR